MVDIVDKKTRSQMMSGIRSKNTKPEIMLRKALFRKGFRYRIHCRELPGRPDIVLRKHNTAIFVHGCFWHGHKCKLFKWPGTRSDFWREKINSNRRRDRKAISVLRAEGWSVFVVWECAFKGSARMNFEEILVRVISALESGRDFLEISGTAEKGV